MQAILLTVIQEGLWFADTLPAIRRILLVAFGASMTAAVSDALEESGFPGDTAPVLVNHITKRTPTNVSLLDL